MTKETWLLCVCLVLAPAAIGCGKTKLTSSTDEQSSQAVAGRGADDAAIASADTDAEASFPGAVGITNARTRGTVDAGASGSTGATVCDMDALPQYRTGPEVYAEWGLEEYLRCTGAGFASNLATCPEPIEPECVATCAGYEHYNDCVVYQTFHCQQQGGECADELTELDCCLQVGCGDLSHPACALDNGPCSEVYQRFWDCSSQAPDCYREAHRFCLLPGIETHTVTNQPESCSSAGGVGPGPGEEGHWVATRLTPPTTPFYVSSVTYMLWDGTFASGERCDSTLPHRVQLFVGTGTEPPSTPMVSKLIQHSGNEGQQTPPFNVYELPLEAPITLNSGEDLWVAIEATSEQPRVTCVATCRDGSAGRDYWSNAAEPPYPWVPNATFDVHVTLGVAMVGDASR